MEDYKTEQIKKRLTVIAILVLSGLSSLGLSFLVDKPELAVVFTPALHYIMYEAKKFLDGDGITNIL